MTTLLVDLSTNRNALTQQVQYTIRPRCGGRCAALILRVPRVLASSRVLGFPVHRRRICFRPRNVSSRQPGQPGQFGPPFRCRRGRPYWSCVPSRGKNAQSWSWPRLPKYVMAHPIRPFFCPEAQLLQASCTSPLLHIFCKVSISSGKRREEGPSEEERVYSIRSLFFFCFRSPSSSFPIPSCTPARQAHWPTPLFCAGLCFFFSFSLFSHLRPNEAPV